MDLRGGERVHLGLFDDECYTGRLGTVIEEQDFTRSKVIVLLDATFQYDSVKVSVKKTKLTIETETKGVPPPPSSSSSSSSSSSILGKRALSVSFQIYL